jgi:hypothetical protein
MAPSCNKADLMRSEVFKQAGRSGHLIFLVETPVISGRKEIDHVVLSKSKRLGADCKACTAFTVKKLSINRVWAAKPEQKVQHTYSVKAFVERERRASGDG